ncbi:MAG: L-rhamnose/proton symporter RhaT [Rikenellaceae bacterium]
MLQVLLGIGLIAFGASLSGSFAMPMTKTKGWAWENSWLAFCLFAYVIFPIVMSFICAPGFVSVLAEQPTSRIVWILSLGFLYGFANLSFGLSLKYLGLSVGYALSLGLMMVQGTIIPAVIDGRWSKMLNSDNGAILIYGLIIGVIGVAVIAYSGYIKEKNENVDKSERNFVKGIAAALFVGFCGSADSLGIEQGSPIAHNLIESGVNPLFQSAPVLIILFGGSFVSTLLCCLYLAKKNSNIKSFVCSGNESRPLTKNYLFCAASGFLWFINFIFYTMGRSRMGEFSFIAWGILMSLTILCGTLWGIYRGEWRNAPRNAKTIMYIGLVILATASFVIGMSSN